MGADLAVAQQFGANLRRARRRVGLSQEEVGFRASLHRTEVGLLERGARTPRIDTLVKLAAALDVRIDCSLLDGINWNAGSRSASAGAFKITSRVDKHRALMKRAEALRASQTETVDAVELVREAREELTERGRRREGDEDEDSTS
jgi:transcriptional regulator with XRE-family HTH domain